MYINEIDPGHYGLIKLICRIFFYFVTLNFYIYKIIYVFREQINMEDLVCTNRSFTITFKLEVIAYAEDTSNRSAAKFYNVDRKEFKNGESRKQNLRL